jgi:hypothetical protein
MAWTKAGTETLTSASLNLDLGATTAMGKNQFTQYITHVLNDGTGNNNDAAPAYTLNDDSSARYTNRATDNLGTEHTFTAQNMMYNSSSTQKDDYFVVAEIASIDGQQIYWQSLLCDKNSSGNSNTNKCESVNSYAGILTESAFNTLSGYSGYGAEQAVSSTQPRKGIKILSGSSAIGKKIKKVASYLRKDGSPTGTFNFKVYRSGSVIATSSGLDPSTLTSSFVQKELELDTIVTLQADDRVVAEYSGSSSSMAVHMVYNNNANSIASGFNLTQWNGSAWSDSAYDLCFGFDSTPASYINQFTRLDNYNNRGSTNGYEYDTGSNATALGSDGVEELIVQDGAVYYDKQLNKEYILSNDTWTEL